MLRALLEKDMDGIIEPGRNSTLKNIVQKFDINNDNLVSLDEFLRGVVTVPELKIVGEVFKWKQIFDTYDADKSGMVDKEELSLMLQDIIGAGKSDSSETEEEKAQRIKEEKLQLNKMVKMFDGDDGAQPQPCPTKPLWPSDPPPSLCGHLIRVGLQGMARCRGTNSWSR